MQPLLLHLQTQAEDMHSKTVQIYRHLHQHPEIGLKEHNTSKYIRNILQNVPGLIILPQLVQLPTAIIAKFTVPKPSTSILFRCQLDALPLKQASGLQYCSSNQLHHACGHDGHMAAMISAIKIISDNRQNLNKNITFCFQPGEEGCGGASKLLASMPTLLNGIQHCYAIHMTTMHYPGTVQLQKGPVTALSSRFSIAIEGKAAHSLCPHIGIDANLIGCQLVSQLYCLTHLNIGPLEGSTLNVYKIQGGSETATVSNNFSIKGSFRVLSNDSYNKLSTHIQKVTKSICDAYGANCSIQTVSGLYRPVVNDQATLINAAKKIGCLNSIAIESNQKSFAGEDFCQFSQKRPSCYIVVGSAVAGSIDPITKEGNYPLHSPFHQLDETAITICVKIWLCLSFL